jgi:hypothetical protein
MAGLMSGAVGGWLGVRPSGGIGAALIVASGTGTLAVGAAVAVPFVLAVGQRPAAFVGGFALGQLVELGFGLDLQAVLSNPGAAVTGYTLTITNNTDNSQAPGFPVDYTYLVQGITP